MTSKKRNPEDSNQRVTAAGRDAVYSDGQAEKQAVETNSYRTRELRHNEESYQRFFENAPVGLYRTTPQGQILLANPALLHMLGYASFEDLAHRNLEQDYFEPGYHRSQYRALLESQGEVRGLEAGWKKQDGSTIYVRENARALRDASGQVLFYEGSVEDISESRQAQRTLQDSQERYRRIVETSHEGIWEMDQDRNTTYVNQRLADMLGYHPDEMIGRRTDSFILEEDLADHNQKIQERKKGQPGQFERRFRRKDGSIVWAIVSAEPVLDEQGDFTGSFGMLTDITERKLAEETLVESEEKWRSLVSASPDYIALHDSEGGYLFLNHYSEGFTEKDVIGTSLYQYLLPESAELFRSNMEKALSTWTTQHFEYTGLGDRGAKRTYEGYLVPLRNKKSEISILSISKDITERKLAEQELERERNLLKALMDTSPDAIYFKDTQLHYLRVSHATALKEGVQQPEQMIGKTDFDFFTPESAQEYYDLEMEIMRTGQALVGLEQEEHRPGLPPTWASTTEVPLRDAAGQVIGVFAISRDITERKQVELELERERNLLKALMDTSPDAIYFMDTQGRYLRVSRATALKEGLQQPEQLIGKTDFDFFDHESAQEFFDLEQEVIRTGEPVIDQEQEERRPGKPTTWGSTTEVPLRDATGQVIGVFGITRDITQRKHMEQALVASEQRLRLAMEAANDGLWDWNIVSGQAYLSPYYYTMLGYTPDEFPANEKVMEKIVHPWDLQAVQQAQNDYLAGRMESYDVEFRALSKSGEVVWIRSRGKLVEWDAEGRPARMVGTHVDITQSRLADAALRESEARFRALIDNAPVAINVSRASVNLYANQKLLQLFGFTGGETPVGRTAMEYFAPQCQEESRERTRRRRLGLPVPPEFESIAQRRDGTQFHMHVAVAPVELSDGPAYMSFLTDISERQKAEEALRQSEAIYRKAIESAGAVPYQQIYLKGSVPEEISYAFIGEGILQLTGYGPEEFTSEVFDSLVVESHLLGDLSPYSTDEAVALVRTGALPYWKCEWLIRTRDGKLRWIFEASVDYFDENGHATSSIGLFQDITDSKQRERQLEAIAVVSGALRSAVSRAEMLPVILDQVMELFQASAAILATPDPSGSELLVVIGRGEGEKLLNLRIPIASSASGRVFQSGQPYLNNAAQEDPLFVTRDLLPDVHALAGVQLSAKGVPIGVLFVGRLTALSTADLRLLTSIADIAANALYRADLFDQTEQRLKYMIAVQQIDNAISSSLDLRVTFNVLLARILEQLQADAADVLILDPHLHRLEYLSGRGFLTPAVENTSIKLGEGLAGRAAMERRSAFIPDLDKATQQLRSGGQLAAEKFVAYHALPLIAKGEVRGVLEVFYRSARTPETDALNMLETIAGQAAIAIENAQLFQGLQRSNTELVLAYDATIEGWAHALELRDNESQGHAQRVAELAERLAARLGLRWEEQAQIHRGALLHDIGKMSVPDYILLKATPLTEEEAAILHQHPQLAFDMLSPIAFLRRALDIPYCHHERWDGSGYPRHLKGSQIPIAARIFSVVDVWDGSTTGRRNRVVISKEQALQNIRSAAGTQFDPQVVEAFLEIMADNG